MAVTGRLGRGHDGQGQAAEIRDRRATGQGARRPRRGPDVVEEPAVPLRPGAGQREVYGRVRARRQVAGRD